MRRSHFDVLGLFPGLSATGGVQASGRTAWEAIAGAREGDAPHASRPPWRPYLFSYDGRGAGGGDKRALVAGSKPRAVVEACRRRWAARLVLIWHLGLLKLLPCFRLADAEVVLFLHGVESWRRQGRLTRLLLRRVNLFLTNSDYTWRRFVELNPEFETSAHKTVHLGIAAPLGAPPPAPAPRPSALMVGRLMKSEDYKGHREVIDAWRLVLERVPDAELLVVGDGDLREELESRAASRGVGAKVRFLGEVPDATKDGLLASCRCLALPSRGEGFGLVYLEAMRMGRPCLVSAHDAAREVVSPPLGGLAVDPGRPEHLADGLARLLSPSREWDDWSASARRRYEGNFTARHFQERLLAALSPPTS